MGRIVGRWCFSGWGPKAHQKEYCADSLVDTGAVLPTIPERIAKRLGVRVRDVAPELLPEVPRDAQGKKIAGDYYLLGAMSSKSHGCYIDPVVVYGQPGHWRNKRPIIGREPLQTMGADIVLDTQNGDGMRCRRRMAAPKAVGAGINLIAIIKSRLPRPGSEK